MSIVAGTAFQFLYDQCILGLHDVENDTLKLALFRDAADIAPATANLYSSLSNEIVTSGYTAGGPTLTQTVTYVSGGANKPIVDFADVVLTNITVGITPGTAIQGGVIYNTTVGPQASKILWIINFGTPIVVDGGNLTLSWPDPTDPTQAMVQVIG